MAFGLLDTQFIDFPEEQNEAHLSRIQNSVGIDYLEFVRRVDGAMAAVNGADPLIKMLTSDTTRDSIITGGYTKKTWQRAAEYTPGRPQRGKGRGGYKLPIYFYEIDLGFTDRALKLMPIAQFEDELQTTVTAIDVGQRADVLERLFDNSEWPLDDDGTGASPGFAGSGTGTNAFVGQLPNGTLTDNTYTHYFQAADTAAALDTAIKAMQANLQLWDRGPFDLIAGPDVIDRITANQADDTQFVGAGSTLVRPGTAESEAMVDPNRYLGVYNGWIRVMQPEYQIAGLGFAIVRSYGPGAERNPLKWRWDPRFGRNTYVEDRRLMPLTEAAVLQTYGLGVGNRTGAALCSLGGTVGVYDPPAINR